MLDHSHIGHEFTPFNVDVEKGRLTFFAKAIGETNPVYTDESAAHAGQRCIIFLQWLRIQAGKRNVRSDTGHEDQAETTG